MNMATRIESSTDAAMVDQAPRALAERHGFTVDPRTSGGYMARDRDGMAIQPEPFATEAAAWQEAAERAYWVGR